MDAACRRLDTPQFHAGILSVWRESPKAENLLITKGRVLDFSLPKAENILKISLLQNRKTCIRGENLSCAECRLHQPKPVGIDRRHEQHLGGVIPTQLTEGATCPVSPNLPSPTPLEYRNPKESFFHTNEAGMLLKTIQAISGIRVNV